MKQRKPDPTIEFSPVKLYLDDLKAIVAILEALEGTWKLEIDVDDFELDSIEEVSAIGKRKTKNFKLIYRSSDLYGVYFINLTRFVNEVRTTSHTIESTGVIHKIADVMSRRRTLLGRITPTMMYISCLAIAVMAVGVAVWNGRTELLAIIIGGATWLALFVSLAYMIILRRSEVILVNRQQDPSFWERKRDDLMVGTILLIIGAVVGIVVAKLWP